MKKTVSVPDARVVDGVGVKAPGGGPSATELSGLLARPDVNVASLLAFWRGRDKSQRTANVEDVCLLAERVLKAGQPLVAYDVLQEGLRQWPGNVRGRQLLALALMRAGATERAFAILQGLETEGIADEETLGMVARIHKDRALRLRHGGKRKRHLRLAHRHYAEAYRKTGGYWTGINAATTAALLDDRRGSVEVARGVRESCLRLLKRAQSKQERFWLLATLGEAALILGTWSEAEDHYCRAGELGCGAYGDLSSTRRNALLLIEHLGIDRVDLDRCLRIPRVAVFAGHMIDAPGRPTPRFPPRLEKAVVDEIRIRLEQDDCRIGFSSAACGSDILFLEALRMLGGETHVVLPCDPEYFRRTSVDIVPGSDWNARYTRALDQATEVLNVSAQNTITSDVLYEYANLLLYGLAAIRAEQLDTRLVPLVVWDGSPAGGPGGTAGNVERWRSLGHEVKTVDLQSMLRGSKAGPEPEHVAVPPSRRSRPRGSAVGKSPMKIIAILFADVVQYSRLSEEEVPRFVDHFLGMVSELMQHSGYRPEIKNTWGDGLFFAFPGVRSAGLFALELSERVNGLNWGAKGLPSELNVRIALHAGPVYPCFDPVTGQQTYMGTHVSRAARIEPITPPGMVYGSQAFAALAAAEHVTEFHCEYVGQTPLAKGYGTYPTFHVRRREE